MELSQIDIKIGKSLRIPYIIRSKNRIENNLIKKAYKKW